MATVFHCGRTRYGDLDRGAAQPGTRSARFDLRIPPSFPAKGLIISPFSSEDDIEC